MSNSILLLLALVQHVVLSFSLDPPFNYGPFSILPCTWDTTRTTTTSNGNEVPVAGAEAVGSAIQREDLTLNELAEFLVGPQLLASGFVTLRNATLSDMTSCRQVSLANFTTGELRHIAVLLHVDMLLPPVTQHAPV